jgi:hypothetical protein
VGVSVKGEQRLDTIAGLFSVQTNGEFLLVRKACLDTGCGISYIHAYSAGMGRTRPRKGMEGST